MSKPQLNRRKAKKRRPVGRPQQQRAERRAQGQRVDRRDHDRHRDRDRELPVQRAGDARHEADRREHRDKDQRRRDDRRGDFRHRPLGRLDWRHLGMLFERAGDVFDDDDRVVDDQRDRQNDREQIHRVRRVAEHIEDRENADQRYRDRDRRDQRRAPILQKDEHDGDHQHQRDAQGPQDFVDIGADEIGRVIDDLVLQVGREAPRKLLHALLDRPRHGQRVGVRRLIDRERRRGLPVERRGVRVLLRRQLDAPDIADAHDAAIRVGAHDDVGELLGIAEPARRDDGKLLLLLRPRRVRRLADLPRRRLDVLARDRAGDVARGDADRRHAHRVEPDAHRILPLPEDLRVADPRQPRDLLLQLHIGVVRDEDLIVRVVRRIQIDREHEIARRGADADPLLSRLRTATAPARAGPGSAH